MIRLMYEYLEHGKRRKLNEKTLKDYEVFLRSFFEFIKDNYPDIEYITDINRDIILSYEKYLVTKKDSREKVLTQGRRLRYLCGLKAFFLYLQKEECIITNPTVNIALPRERKRIIKDVLTPGEMDKLLKKCTGDSIKSLRDRAILELLYSTGMRADELCNVETRDIDLDEMVLLVQKGKMGNMRLIPFGKSAGYWVKRYMKSARNLINDTCCDLLFVTLRGKKLTPVTLCRLTKEYAEKADIDKNVTTHTFRHTCATHMLKGHADIRYVQKQLGHKSISTTEKYLKIDISDLKVIHERTHPREQEEWGD